MTEQPTQELLEQVCSLMEQGRFKEVLAIHDELFERFQILNDEGIFRTLAALDEVSRRVGGSSGAAERKLVLGVLLRKGWLFELTQQHEQALTACDELLQHIGGESDVTLLHHVSQMLFFKASAMGRLKRLEEELAAYDEVVRRLARSRDPDLADSVTQALWTKALRLKNAQRYAEAVPVYDEVLQRADGIRIDWLRERAAHAVVDKGESLERLGRLEEALSTYEEGDRRFGGSSEERSLTREAQRDLPLSDFTKERRLAVAAVSLLNRGILLGRMKRTEEALSCFDRAVRRAGNTVSPLLCRPAAQALLYKTMLLASLNRPHESRAAMNQALRRFEDTPWVLVDAAGMLLEHETFVMELGLLDQALLLFEELMGRFPPLPESPLLLNLAMALDHMHLGLVREAKRRWRENRPRALELLDKARVKITKVMELRSDKPQHRKSLGYIAFLQGRRDEARMLVTEAVQRSNACLRTLLMEVPPATLPEDVEFKALLKSLLQSPPCVEAQGARGLGGG